jgi:dipeptidyl aminopeptidase/acylaminoacyl peptidase
MMKLLRLSTQFLLLALLYSTTVLAQANNGKLLEQTPYKIPVASYQEWIDGLQSRAPADARDTPFDAQTFRRNNPPELYARLQKGEGVECFKLKYLSDGLQVVGYLIKPKTIKGKLPVVIYNRGGNREFGRMTLGVMLELSGFAEAGFVVLASEYRGNGGGEGKEEMGGADINDVLNLLPLAESLGYADTKNLFVYGLSRGGMMTYLALKNGLPARAAAVIGGPTDLLAEIQSRPEMEAAVYRELMPDYDKRKTEHLQARSAMYWAEKLNVPLLIQHGGADWRVQPSQSLKLATRLQELQKPYELVIYAEDDHPLTRNNSESQQRIINWFRRYLKQDNK